MRLISCLGFVAYLVIILKFFLVGMNENLAQMPLWYKKQKRMGHLALGLRYWLGCPNPISECWDSHPGSAPGSTSLLTCTWAGSRKSWHTGVSATRMGDRDLAPCSQSWEREATDGSPACLWQTHTTPPPLSNKQNTLEHLQRERKHWFSNSHILQNKHSKRDLWEFISKSVMTPWIWKSTLS